MNKLLIGDCLTALKDLEDGCCQLIMTSPPYADSRKKTYGGIHPDHYVEWFLPRAKELLRILSPTGTFILNIKEKVVDGERHIYVIDLIKALREQGWRWTEEFCWHKKNCFPGKWPTRFRDSWERCLQFNKSKIFDMYQDEVRVPIGDWSKTRLNALSEKDKTRDDSAVGSGFGKNVSNWIGRDTVYPTNVLYLSTECGNKKHSAAFPIALPIWFIKLFTKTGDLVIDPFVGSGTTVVAAKQLNRQFLGIDIKNEYVKLSEQRLQNEAISK